MLRWIYTNNTNYVWFDSDESTASEDETFSGHDSEDVVHTDQSTSSYAKCGHENRLKRLPVMSHLIQEAKIDDSRVPIYKQIEPFVDIPERPHEKINNKVVYNFTDRLVDHRRILDNDCLVFNSHFESGNLYKVTRVIRTDKLGSNFGK